MKLGVWQPVGKNNREKRFQDHNRPLKDRNRQESIRSSRHVVKQILKDGEYEELDYLEENKLEKEQWR